MPRRKQDCPKRMKWEEGASGDRGKDGEYGGEVGDSDVGSSQGVNVSMTSKEPTEEEEESSSNSSHVEADDVEVVVQQEQQQQQQGEEEEVVTGNSKRLRVVSEPGDNQITVSEQPSIDNHPINNSNMAATAVEEVEDDAQNKLANSTELAGLTEVDHASPSAHRPTLGKDLASSLVAYNRVSPSVPVISPPPTSSISFQPTLATGSHHHHHHLHHPLQLKEEEVLEDMTSSDVEDGPLDFSVKKKAVLKQLTQMTEVTLKEESVTDDAPLDLSVSSSRKRTRSDDTLDVNNSSHVGIMQHVNAHLGHMVSHRNKSIRLDNSSNNNSATTAAAKPSSPWSNQFPFRFSPSSSPNSGVEIPMWNGGVKSTGSRSTPSPSSTLNCNVTGNHYQGSEHHQNSTAARHHQSTSSAAGAARDSSPVTHHHHHKSSTTSSGGSGVGGGRHNAWQSHWLSRGAEQAKDVLKCVWCRKSFRSLEEMTTHMKEARHCGMHMPHQTSLPPPLPPPPLPPHSSGQMKNSNSSSSSGVNSSSTATKKVNGDEQQQTTLKEQQTSLPMPRKLVRGQDVWLGKGAEQTKQILKCMWCGQSFKTLAEMTTHMQQTQHYTNIISQEQIISWKSPEDKMAASGQAHVNAVLTCKVCDQAFSSLKELSNHMVKNSHYKEHILRSITENGGRRRQTREKRKKSLPVRKLLELERAQNEMNRMHNPADIEPPPNATHQHRTTAKSSADSNGRISCEKCGRKIDTHAFVDHIRQCVGNVTGSDNNQIRTTSVSSSSISSLSTLIASVSPKSDKRSCSPRSKQEISSSPRMHVKQSYSSPILQPSPTPPESNGQLVIDNSNGSAVVQSGGIEVPSVLNAIERLIEKSFDGKQSRGNRYVTSTNTGSNRTTPSSTNTPLSQPTLQQQLEMNKTDDERRHQSDSEDEEDFRNDMSYQKLVIDEGVGGGALCLSKNENAAEKAKDEELERKRKRKKSRRRSSSSINRLSSPSDVMQMVDHRMMTGGGSSNVRASPLSTSSRRDASSPARSLESPGSCSNCSSHGTIASAHGGGIGAGGVSGGLSLVRSSPSPSSPTADHPLKELQKLLDKTNVSLSKSSTSVSVVRDALSPAAQAQSTSPVLSYGAWTSNLVESSSSSALHAGSDVIHCNFCDNSFASKSAFRHHVSKVHAAKAMTSSGSNFTPSPAAVTSVAPLNMSMVASGRISSPSASSSSSSSSSSPANSPAAVINNNNNNTNNINNSKSNNGNAGGDTSSSAPAPDESPHSKFLKYTELAKQLSSKYV